jgi:hypothetical protein
MKKITLDDLEKDIENVVCTRCTISEDEKDCSSCELFFAARDGLIKSLKSVNIEVVDE